MPTKKKIIGFPVDDELFKKLSDYRFENRINTLSEAIRLLIEKGLQKKGKPPKK